LKLDNQFNILEDRIELLKSIKYINDVWDFNSRSELEVLIKHYQPDIMVIGSDWKGGDVVGKEYTNELKFFDRIGDYSSTINIHYLNKNN
tara:strand:- start:185 stop:454 length:270 start_codon:yes stop_codon:yes gene_type:complete